MERKSRMIRAFVFTVASAATLAGSGLLIAQNEVDVSPACGLWSGPLCNVKETCAAIPGTDASRCTKEYTYYR
jgi:hypothetical protein